MAKKNYFIPGDKIVQVLANFGSCMATDKIMVEGYGVGIMYREESQSPMDSGWRFFGGDEDEAYMANPAFHDIYDVNTVINYDPAIVPYLDAPVGSRFGRESTTTFIPLEVAPKA